MIPDDQPWFEAKKYGYGTGRPLTWQGWAVTLSYLLIVIGAANLLLPDSVAAFLAIMLSATAAFLLLAARKTRGGWQWRWGRSEAPPPRTRRGRRK